MSAQVGVVMDSGKCGCVSEGGVSPWSVCSMAFLCQNSKAFPVGTKALQEIAVRQEESGMMAE